MHPRLCSNDHLREAGRTSGTHIATAHRSTIARTPKLPTLLHYSAVAVTKSAAVSLNLGYNYGQLYVEEAGSLDYRMPVALDLPMIEPLVVEVPNPKHPYGVCRVGENAIVAPLAAVANGP